MDQTANQKALAELDVPGLKVVADAKDAETMEKSAGCKIKFLEALKLAVDALLNNAQGSENGNDSVASLLMDTPEQHGSPATLGILIWAIVDKTGKKAGYCYAV